MMKYMKTILPLLVLMTAVFTSVSQAASDPIYTSYLSNAAVQGYDPVTFFTDGAPKKGLDEFSTTYKGADFYFSSKKNLDLFTQNPDAYAPQYGGYCAWAVSQGYTAKGDAKHWKIVDGKLYLNYSKSVQDTWAQDISGHITKADQNWPGLIK